MHERWGVPHMLDMTAAQEGGPVAVVIKAEAGEGFCHVGEVRDPELIWPSRHELTIAEIRGPAVMACVRCRDPRAPTRKQG